MPQGPNTPYTGLDQNQILQRIFEEDEDRIRVNAAVTVNTAETEVIMSHEDDSVRLGDGTSFLTSTTDGAKVALDVNVINPGDTIVGTTVNTFNSITAVASGVLTTISTYTVPALTSSDLKRVFVAGTNIAKYEILVNGTLFDAGYTYFGSSLNQEFSFDGTDLDSGDIVAVRVLHNRPDVGDFNARIQVTETDT